MSSPLRSKHCDLFRQYTPPIDETRFNNMRENWDDKSASGKIGDDWDRFMSGDDLPQGIRERWTTDASASKEDHESAYSQPRTRRSSVTSRFSSAPKDDFDYTFGSTSPRALAPAFSARSTTTTTETSRFNPTVPEFRPRNASSYRSDADYGSPSYTSRTYGADADYGSLSYTSEKYDADAKYGYPSYPSSRYDRRYRSGDSINGSPLASPRSYSSYDVPTDGLFRRPASEKERWDRANEDYLNRW